MPETPRQYPVQCDKCKEEKGFPFQVRTLVDPSGAIEIRLRCRGCGHEWARVILSDD
jgi:DNA-directed RNA polymerase subunit M/transcription elongation factor TFIIS